MRQRFKLCWLNTGNVPTFLQIKTGSKQGKPVFYHYNASRFSGGGEVCGSLGGVGT